MSANNEEQQAERLARSFLSGDISRRSFMRRAAGFSAVALSASSLGAVLAACSSTTSDEPSVTAGAVGTPTAGGTLKAALTGEPDTIDPATSTIYTGAQVYDNIFNKLIDLDPSNEFYGQLATAWNAPDDQTWVFDLVDTATFHNGEKFGPDDVVYTFERILNPKTASSYAPLYDAISKVEATGPTQVTFHLKTPFGPFLSNLANNGEIVNQKAIESSDPSRNAIGTGPFEFVEWVKDSHLVIKRHDGYWNKQGGPYLDRVRYRPIPDDVVKLQSLQSGEIDVMDYVQPRDVAAVKADKNVVVVDVPSLADFAYQLNTTKPPFNVKALRQAVAYAIDLEQIVKGVWLNVGVAANGPIPPTSWAYDKSIAPIKRDLAKAKAKLAEGGQPSGFTFTLTTNNIPINVQEAEVMQAQLREAGITVKVKLVDSATLIADGNNKNFEMISFQWSGRPDPDGNTYQFLRTTPGTSFNWSGISNPQIDTLLDRTREISNQAERRKLYGELTRILQDELPMVFIIHPVEPKAFSPKVQNYEAIPDGMMRFKDVWMR